MSKLETLVRAFIEGKPVKRERLDNRNKGNKRMKTGRSLLFKNSPLQKIDFGMKYDKVVSMNGVGGNHIICKTPKTLMNIHNYVTEYYEIFENPNGKILFPEELFCFLISMDRSINSNVRTRCKSGRYPMILTIGGPIRLALKKSVY